MPKGYRFAFNGKEKTDEWNGDGVMYDYGFRIYDPRIGKFLSVDPLAYNFPWFTPFQFAGNSPICNVDLDGLENKDYRDLEPAGITDLIAAGAIGDVFLLSLNAMNNLASKDAAILAGEDTYSKGIYYLEYEEMGKRVYFGKFQVPVNEDPIETALTCVDAAGVGGGSTAGYLVAKTPAAAGATLKSVVIQGKRLWTGFSSVGDAMNVSMRHAKGLYKINFSDGSTYIGRSINFYRRMKQHFKYDGSKFKTMIDEIENIEFMSKINSTIKELREGEQELIDLFKSEGKELKNARNEMKVKTKAKKEL